VKLTANKPISLLLLVLALCACECEDEPPPVEPAPAPPPPRAQIAAPRAVATSAAFDLIPSGDGALLFFGPPAEDGGGIRVLSLGPLGEVEAAEDVLWTVPTTESHVAPYAVEVAAAGGGGRVGVAWVARHGRVLHVHTSHGAPGAHGPATDLGPMEDPPRVTRGHVALAGAPDGTITLIHRRTRGPCSEGGGADCSRLAVRRLGDDRASIRSGMPLVIPRVCDQPVPGYVWADGTWYYALCAETDGVPETTLYAIRYEPQYAQADRALRGCEPLGLGRVGTGATLMLGRCDEGRIDGVRLAEMGTERSSLTSVVRRIECAEGRPRIVIDAGSTRLEVPLSEAAPNLAALLPEQMAPQNARAIWTGQALLVAAPIGGEVSLRRFQCEDGGVLRTDRM